MDSLERLMGGQPYQPGDFQRSGPQVPRQGIGEAVQQAFTPDTSLGGALQMLMMSMGRMPGSARVSPSPVVPLRPFKPTTTFTGEPPSAANMNPPKQLNWVPEQDVGGFSFATDAQGRNLAGVSGRWNWNGGEGSHFAYEPQIQGPVPNGTTSVHTGPQFRSRDIAQQYADALLKSGKYGPKPDPSFSAPFLEKDSQVLRQLMADQARSKFGIVE